LGKANAVVPHVARFLVERKAVKRVEFHRGEGLSVQCLSPLRVGLPEGFIRTAFSPTFGHAQAENTPCGVPP
jgi:hypothetical protein